MILIESNNSSGNILSIDAELMFRDVCVEEICIRILRSGVHIMPTNTIRYDLLPFPVRTNKLNLLDWFVERGLTMRTHRNIYFTELPLNSENRNPKMPFLLSLSSNSVSLADKYWINPKITTEFICNGAEITFERKSWDEVNPFANQYIPGVLEQYGLNDVFYTPLPGKIMVRSLIWTTQGEKNKRWMIDKKGYILEKKLAKAELKNELKTLDFFSLNGILTPQYDYYIKDLNRDDEIVFGSFEIDTINEGLHVIQKTCLTDSCSYLDNVSNYFEIGESVEEAIRKMFSQHGIENDEVVRFVEIVREYQKKFDVTEDSLDTRNFGLYVAKDSIQPVVWGRLKMTTYSFGCI